MKTPLTHYNFFIIEFDHYSNRVDKSPSIWQRPFDICNDCWVLPQILKCAGSIRQDANIIKEFISSISSKPHLFTFSFTARRSSCLRRAMPGEVRFYNGSSGPV